MKFGEDFYIFEVVEEYTDFTIKEENKHLAHFEKGYRFIGFILEYRSGNKFAVKSNMDEMIQIPLENVKLDLKIVFEELDEIEEFKELKEVLNEKN